MINQYKDVRKTTVKKLFRRSYLIFSYEFILYNRLVKGVRIRSYSGPYFPAFGLNTDQNNSEYGHFSRSAMLPFYNP